MQYSDTGWIGIAITLVVIILILTSIRGVGSNQVIRIRKIPGLAALDDAVGRATEMGRPILMVPGIGGIGSISLQAINIFSHVTRLAARLSTPIRLCAVDSAVYTLAQEIISDVYRTEGLSDRYDPDSIRFISDRQFAFAAGVAGLIYREQIAASFLFGDFFAESLIFAEAANSIGAIQIAASTQNTQTPFFIASCDYVLVGEEFYAASAYLTKEPILMGSILGQDRCKMLLIILIVVGILLNSFDKAYSFHKDHTLKTNDELLVNRLLMKKDGAR
jgi:hypothetical protein